MVDEELASIDSFATISIFLQMNISAALPRTNFTSAQPLARAPAGC